MRMVSEVGTRFISLHQIFFATITNLTKQVLDTPCSSFTYHQKFWVKKEAGKLRLRGRENENITCIASASLRVGEEEILLEEEKLEFCASFPPKSAATSGTLFVLFREEYVWGASDGN